MNQLDKLKKMIDKHIVISFDVFDTLLMRIVNIPEQIFELVGNKATIGDFRDIREKCQRIASEQALLKGKPHANLDEIYSAIKIQYADVNIDWDNIKQLELEVEKECLYDNTEMHEIFNYAKTKGKQIILVSDMYLDTVQMKELLSSCGYTDYDAIYVSADVNCTKYNGDIYEYISNREEVLGKKILHIGDNVVSDFKNAKKYGWDAYLYENHLVEKKNISNNEFILSRGLTNKISDSNSDFWFKLGSYVGGPLYLGLVEWVKSQILDIGYKKVYFLARDGYILYHLLKDEKKFDCTYVYTSRRAMLLAGIDKLDDEAFAILPPFTTGQTVKYILEYLDMVEVCKEYLESADLCMDYIIQSLEDYDKVRNLYKLSEKGFLKKCADERKNVKEYFQSIGMFDENAIFFDCGWKGTSQYLLDRCLNTMGYNKQNYFLYAGILSTDVSRKQLNNRKYSCFLFDVDTLVAERRSIFENIVLFELFFGAPEKSVLRYDSNGIVFEDLETDFQSRENIFLGIKAYLDEVKKWAEKYNLYVDSNMAIYSVTRLIEQPSIEEAITIGNVKNIDGYGVIEGVDKYIARLDMKTYRSYPDIDIYWLRGLLARPDIEKRLKKELADKYNIPYEIQTMKRKKIKKHVKSKGFQYGDLYQLLIKDQKKRTKIYEKFDYNPLISIVIPVYNVEDIHLCACIDSVCTQIYNNWELILVDDASTWTNVRKTLKLYERNSKIRVIYRSENGHISIATNDGIRVTNGDYIAFMDCDDVITSDALYEFVKKINENKKFDFIYSDEDKITENGSYRHGPFFKPDWSYDTFMSIMYTNHLALYRTSIVKALGGLRSEYNGAQDYDFTLRFIEQIDQKNIGHIPRVLYNWRERRESIAINPDAKPYAVEAVRKAKESLLERSGIKGNVEYVRGLSQYRIVYDVVGNPKVSIVVLCKENEKIDVDLIKSKINYPNYEIVKIQSIKEIKKIVNTTADYILFLDSCINLPNGDWFVRLLGHAQQPHTGAVGSKILYDGTHIIYHDGIALQEIGPVYSLQGMDDRALHYYCHNKVEYNVMAVSISCLMISKDKLLKIDYFNEEMDYESAGIDLCIKLWKKGFLNVVRNDSIVYIKRNQSEQMVFSKMIEMPNVSDPFYNENLTPSGNDYSVKIMPNSMLFNKRIEKYGAVKYNPLRKLFCLDHIKSEMNYIYISGWFFVAFALLSNILKPYIALCDKNDNINIFSSYKVVRKDVADALKNNAYNVGFDCYIEKDKIDLSSGDWKIGIGFWGIGRKFHVVWTDKIIKNNA